MARKTSIMFVANGSEEMEIVITADILRRADISVMLCSISDEKNIRCSRGVNLCADEIFSKLDDEKFDIVILPGGLVGSQSLCKSEEVGKFLKEHEEAGKVVAAICAAPVALKAHGIGKGKRLTSYPSIKDQLSSDYVYVEDQTVVIDGNLITSQGPATAIAFALGIIEHTLDKETCAKISKGLLYDRYHKCN